jgi:tetratricopeptide (TPR) repeat protein
MVQVRQDLDALFIRRDVHGIMLEAANAESDPSYRAEQAEKAFVYAACVLSGSGKWMDVSAWAEKGLALCQDTELTPLLHHLYGAAQVHVGDCNRAVKHLIKFRTLSKDRPQLEVWLGDHWAALAEAYRFLGDHKREVINFGLAARFYEQKGLHERAADCHADIAWSYLIRDQVGHARAYLRRLSTWEQEARTKPHLALALYHALVGERVKAVAFCHDLLERLTLNHEQKVDVLWILALMHWRAGEAEMARCFALTARQFAMCPWSPLQMTRVENLLGTMDGKADTSA